VTSSFTVFAAVDLRGGRAVRLRRGDPGAEEVFGEDPVAVARRWVAEGAPWLHVVDLDGAFAGHPVQLDLLRRIAAAVSVPVQAGGGLRSVEDVAQALAAGAARVVLGTRALDPAFLARLLDRFGPERVVGGLDARGRRVAVAGWRQDAGVERGEAARRLAALGLREVVYTQVERDGTLEGPDLEGVAEVAAAGLRVVASGGVADVADVARLAAWRGRGVVGVVLGRALYTGRIGLREALEAAAGAPLDREG
jgi:phosphoribosylformimino-5-aminoimidazole carboxamide ribotide isomerase